MREQKKSLQDLLKVDKRWTLFLDRDGVINRRIERDYVRNWKQFEFLPRALEAISGLSNLFGRIIIVTNQRSIARGLMTVGDLNDIHRRMLLLIRDAGGRIDGIYYCPHELKDNCDCRKPKIGMVLRAKTDFPEIDFKRSIVVGDSVSDMEFAEKIGALRVLIADERIETNVAQELADVVVGSLYGFWQLIQTVRLSSDENS